MACAVRAALFQNLQQSVERVIRRLCQPKTSSASSGTGESSQFILTDNYADVLALLYAIEDCLFHGAKVRVSRRDARVLYRTLICWRHLQKSGDQVPHCWHFLETLGRENSLAFGPTILAVGLLTNVHTERGLVREFSQFDSHSMGFAGFHVEMRLWRAVSSVDSQDHEPELPALLH